MPGATIPKIVEFPKSHAYLIFDGGKLGNHGGMMGAFTTAGSGQRTKLSIAVPKKLNVIYDLDSVHKRMASVTQNSTMTMPESQCAFSL